MDLGLLGTFCPYTRTSVSITFTGSLFKMLSVTQAILYVTSSN